MEQHPDIVIIRNRIRDHRRESAVTQSMLASAVGVSRQSIISVETGKCLPSVPLAIAIAKFFNTQIEDLFVVKSENETTVKEYPMRELSPFRRPGNLNDVIGSLLDDSFMSPRSADTLMPKMDIYQTEKELIVEADVPGLTESEVDIEISEGVLTIKGERKEEIEEKGKEFFHREVNYGSFQRALTLPVDVVPEKTSATVKNGHLKVVLPKIEPVQPKVHKVKTSGE